MTAPDIWADVPILTAKSRIRHLEAGEMLFHQGDPVLFMFQLKTGRLRLVRFLEDGASVVLHVARPGDTFAEASAFSAVYHCDAVADLASEIEAVSKADFLAALTTDPTAFLGIAQALAGQVRDLRARAELRGIRSAVERVLAWLRMQASGNPPTVRMRRTWTEIAAELGLTREATYRALAELSRTGRIVRQRGGEAIRLATTSLSPETRG